MDWSIDGQTPEFLAATRMISLSAPIVETILCDLRLEEGMRVLDVGCGSGEYCFRLGSATRGVQFTGLEYDPRFVEFANARARGEVGYPFEQPNPANDYQFVCGDGLNLPFLDGTFDAVISHTYLTALPDWAGALAEMCRVCKPGGAVSSVTSLTDDFYGTGTIELFTSLAAPSDAEVMARVDGAKGRLFADMPLASGIAPRKAPVAFAWMGLENVRCKPLGQYFCLSDADVDADDYRRYVDLLCEMERTQLSRLAALLGKRAPADGGHAKGGRADGDALAAPLPADGEAACARLDGWTGQPIDSAAALVRLDGRVNRPADGGQADGDAPATSLPPDEGAARARLDGGAERPGDDQAAWPEMPTEEDLARYAELIEQRRDFLMSCIGANREWSWYGNSSLLVSGTVPQGGLAARCAPFREANRQVGLLRRACESAGLRVSEHCEQLGPGRCVKAMLSLEGASELVVCGFDPPSALSEGYAKLLARHLDEAEPETEASLPETVRALVAQERACEGAEQRAPRDASPGRAVPDELAFASDRVWESVSEAALSGLAVRFAYAGEKAPADLPVIACALSKSACSATAIAAHPELHAAIERSLARALGEI